MNDRVEKISITMNQGEFDVTVGGEAFRIRPATNDKQVVNYSGNSLTLSEKRTSAKHAVGGSRYDKSTLLQVGDSATFLVKLSGGRIVSSKIATDEDRITLKFKNASPQQASDSGSSLDSELQARTLLIEIQKLEQEIKTGVAGKAVVTGNNSFGQGFQGKVTYKFTEAEIAEKKNLLELKRAQLAGLVAQ